MIGAEYWISGHSGFSGSGGVFKQLNGLCFAKCAFWSATLSVCCQATAVAFINPQGDQVQWQHWKCLTSWIEQNCMLALSEVNITELENCLVDSQLKRSGLDRVFSTLECLPTNCQLGNTRCWSSGIMPQSKDGQVCSNGKYLGRYVGIGGSVGLPHSDVTCQLVKLLLWLLRLIEVDSIPVILVALIWPSRTLVHGSCECSLASTGSRRLCSFKGSFY